MNKLLILFFGLFLLLGCNQEKAVPKPDKLISEELYLDLFYELEVLRVYQNRGISNQTIDSLYEEIFKKHNADTVLFRLSHEYYQSEILKQLDRTDSVVARIEQDLEAFNVLDSVLKAQERLTKE